MIFWQLKSISSKSNYTKQSYNGRKNKLIDLKIDDCVWTLIIFHCSVTEAVGKLIIGWAMVDDHLRTSKCHRSRDKAYWALLGDNINISAPEKIKRLHWQCDKAVFDQVIWLYSTPLPIMNFNFHHSNTNQLCSQSCYSVQVTPQCKPAKTFDWCSAGCLISPFLLLLVLLTAVVYYPDCLECCTHRLHGIQLLCHGNIEPAHTTNQDNCPT